MAEPAPNRSESKTLVVALIGAGATVVAALIGLAPVLFGDRKTEARSPGESINVSDRGKDSPAHPPRVEARPTGSVPVTVSGWRTSPIPGKGLVLAVTNDSARPLKNVQVHVQSAGGPGERSYRVARSLAAGESLSIGWRELDGWPLKPGDRVRIAADGYVNAVETVVPSK